MPSDLANRLTDTALAVGPRCARTHVIAIDGPSGSGKTTLAEAVLAAALERGLSCSVVRTDAICPGWSALPQVPAIVHGLLADLANVGVATYPTWDWDHDKPGGPVTISATDVLILDGVGSGAKLSATYLSVRRFLDAPETDRKARALARDGDTFAPHWDAWAAAERDYFATDSAIEDR